MSDIKFLLDIQKEVLQLIQKDPTLREKWDVFPVEKQNTLQHNFTGFTSMQNFTGFIINSKSGINAHLGFPMKKLKSFTDSIDCNKNGVHSSYQTQYVKSIEHCAIKNIVYVKLVMENVLEKVFKTKQKKEVIERLNGNNESVLVCHLNGSESNSIANIRALLYSIFLKRFFAFYKGKETSVVCNFRNADADKGFTQLLSQKDIMLFGNELSVKHIEREPLIDTNNHTAVIDDLVNKFPQFVTRDDKCILVDGTELDKIIHEKRIFSKNIGFIKVLEGGNPTNHLNHALHLKKLLEQKMGDLIHISPKQSLFQVQKSALLLDCLCQDVPQKFIAYEGKPVLSMDSLLEKRKDELNSSYRSRYGNVVKGDQWEETIKNVAIASVTLDIFSLSLNNELKDDRLQKVSCLSSRKSLFILYNYARLSKLKEHFEEQVKCGVYKALPPIDDVDLSSITEESEWHLILHYIVMFPNLLQRLYSSLSNEQSGNIQLPVNIVCQFLCDLSHDFSSYYHQTKILLDPRPHLANLMYARLYFSFTLMDVMDECFMLLGVNPPREM